MTAYQFLNCEGIKHFFPSVWLWFTQIFGTVIEKPDIFTVAGIHTALLAILLTGLSAYVLFIFSKIQDMEMRALQEAENINTVGSVRSFYGTTTQAEAFDRDKLVEMLDRVMDGHDHPSLPINQEERIEKALQLMAKITEQYPFPEKIFKTKEGHYGARGEPEPIYFGNIGDVRKWVKVMDEISGHLLYWQLYEDSFSSMLGAFSKSEKVVELKKLHKDGLSSIYLIKKDDGTPFFLPEEDEPISIYKAFLNKMRSARQIMKTTGYYLKRTDVFRDKYPSKTILLLGFFLGGISFIFGVIVPLLCQSVRTGTILMPFLFYGLIYMYLFNLMFRYVRQISCK
jgi:hypothetical protein